jgi:Flp pilus assembly pilin Flp
MLEELTNDSFRGYSMKEIAHSFIFDEDGQGITEYGAILAFVAILVALVFSITQGALRGAICAAFSAVVSQLNHLSSAAASATS